MTETANQTQSEIPPLASADLMREARNFVDLLIEHVPVGEDTSELFGKLALLFRRLSYTESETIQGFLIFVVRNCYAETLDAATHEEAYLAGRWKAGHPNE